MKSTTMPSSDVETDVVRMRALADASFVMTLMLWPSSLSGGDDEPELQEADELPGLEPSHLSNGAQRRSYTKCDIIFSRNLIKFYMRYNRYF